MSRDIPVERGEPSPEESEALERAWGTPRGVVGWLSSIDHKVIGRRFIVTAFGFFAA